MFWKKSEVVSNNLISLKAPKKTLSRKAKRAPMANLKPYIQAAKKH